MSDDDDDDDREITAAADLQLARALWCARMLRAVDQMAELLRAGDGTGFLALRRRSAIALALGGDGAEDDAEVDALVHRATLEGLR